jgi:hypothetical protein
MIKKNKANWTFRWAGIFKSDKFNWEGNEGSVFISDLAHPACSIWHCVYSDSADQGFFVQSTKTNEVAPFLWEKTIWKDGSIRSWLARSAIDPDITITIFND